MSRAARFPHGFTPLARHPASRLAALRTVALAGALCVMPLACSSDSETQTGSGGGGGSSGGSGGSGGSAASGAVGGSMAGGSGGGAASGGAAGSAGSGAVGGTSSNDQTRIRVHYRAASAFQIKLRGAAAGLSWDSSTELIPAESGVWELKLQGLASDLEYKPVLEGPTGEPIWPKGASLSNWIISPGQTQDIYPFYASDNGSLDSFQVSHPSGPRDVVVYLPPSYSEPGAADKRYPMLVLQDGQNLFDASAFFGGWRLDAGLDALLAQGHLLTSDHSGVAWQGGSAQELIVVGVHNSAARIVEYTPTNASVLDCDASTDTCGGGGADYLSFVIDSVLPAVHQRYRTQSARAGFGGSSLGGLLSLQACFTRSESFSRCLAMSPSLWWDDEWALSALPNATPGDPISVYLDAGTQSDGLALLRQLNQDLQAASTFTAESKLWCLEGAGMGHNELAWAARAPWAVYWAYQDPQRVQAPVQLPADLSRCN